MNLRLLACDFAATALAIYECAYPGDERPRNAVDVARRFAIGEATDEERAAASAAAWAASAAASYAASAAARAAQRDTVQSYYPTMPRPAEPRK